jgi:hypothetical protein
MDNGTNGYGFHPEKRRGAMKQRAIFGIATSLALALLCVIAAADGQAAITCEREVSADVVVIDQPLMFNRLGAGNPNGMI